MAEGLAFGSLAAAADAPRTPTPQEPVPHVRLTLLRSRAKASGPREAVGPVRKALLRPSSLAVRIDSSSLALLAASSEPARRPASCAAGGQGGAGWRAPSAGWVVYERASGGGGENTGGSCGVRAGRSRERRELAGRPGCGGRLRLASSPLRADRKEGASSSRPRASTSTARAPSTAHLSRGTEHT